MAEISAEQVKLQLEENLPALLEKITKYEATVKSNSDKINQLEEELKKKDAIITILKKQLEDQIAEGEKIKAQNVKESEEIVILQAKTDNTLTRAKEMIFEKTKIVKNQELQIDALNQQILSLKEVVSITKDLLEIRNLEVKQLEIKMQCMEDKIAAEKERQDLMHKKLEHMIRHNGELKREYETQLCLFSALRERYNERELARDVLSNATETVNGENNNAPPANGLNNNTPPGTTINDATVEISNNDDTVQTSNDVNNEVSNNLNNTAPVVSNTENNGHLDAAAKTLNNVSLEAVPNNDATAQTSSVEENAKTGTSSIIAPVEASNNTAPVVSNDDAANKTPEAAPHNVSIAQFSSTEKNVPIEASNNIAPTQASNNDASVETPGVAKNAPLEVVNNVTPSESISDEITPGNKQEPQKQPE